MKNRILEALGVAELQPAAGLNASLAANDRIKFYFSLLQLAVSHADHPEQPAASLKRERLACGIDDPSLDELVVAARESAGLYTLPGASKVMGHIATDMGVMAAPVLAAGRPRYEERLEHLLEALPAATGDRLWAADIAAITRAGGHGGSAGDKAGPTDSLHALVMDLHKELNVLQAAMAEEQLDGASVYGLADTDRPYVKAFMAGVNRTARLKFGHPGLGTTATSSGKQLVIQNDIGTTDAHVIVIHVQAQAVTVTYSDVHPERVQFFEAMLAPRKVDWDGEHMAQSSTLAAGMPFQLVTGHFQAADEAEALEYLAFVGSRLVFLIDWNRARKQLRGFLRGPERLTVLRWAAENDVGHRGFLEVGGAQVVNQAIEAAAGTAMHFGDRLCDVLGTEPTVAFLKFALDAATHGLQAGQSRSLIGDRIRAELQRHFSNDECRLLGVASDHAGLIFEIASVVRDGILAAGAGEHGFDKRAKRATRYEHNADLLVVSAREAARRRPDHAVFRTLLEVADDVADHLEDVAFLLGLLADSKLEPDESHHKAKHHDKADPERLGGYTLEALLTLSEITLEAVQEWIKALGHAAHVRTPGQREDTDDFLSSIDRVSVLEHQADDAQRLVTRLAVLHAADFRQLHLYAAIGDALEQGMDALKHASLILRSHVLGEVLGG